MERIQPFGFLIAAYANGVIARASENLAIFLDVSGEWAIGHRLDELIDGPALALINERLDTMSATDLTARLYGATLRQDRKPIDLSLHRSGSLNIIEGEWSGLERCVDAAAKFRDLLGQLVKAPTLEQFHLDAAKFVRQMTGFDRVLIYQLSESGAGHVIAEDGAESAESLLGLRYPASDIPSQARELYLRNAFRFISNVSAPFVRILPEDLGGAEPLDLSLSTTRAVSPIHLEYLRNMRVGASLSISIIVNGRLWGLVVCHHHQPKLPGFPRRTAVELLGQMYAMALAPRLLSRIAEEDREVRIEALQVVEALTKDLSSIKNLDWVAKVIALFIQFDGIALMVGGQLSSRGFTPELQVIRKITRWLSSALIVKPFATDNFEWQGIAKTSVGCRGLFAIPLSNTSHDFVVLFRREHVAHVIWAGDPNKASWNEQGRPYLSPRKSFAPYMETITDQAKPHTTRELRAADILKDAFCAGLSAKRIPERRLSPRLPVRGGDEGVADILWRAPAVFSLIRGLVDCDLVSGGQVATYCAPLGERVAALALAYDRLSNPPPGVVSLQSLFKSQLALRAEQIVKRVVIEGVDQDLQPDAVLPMALVVHELISMALTTGALALEGRVDINLGRSDSGLMLTWREVGLPVPRNRAYATRAASLSLVTRVVTDDLQGRSNIEILHDGLEARLFVPERCLAA